MRGPIFGFYPMGDLAERIAGRRRQTLDMMSGAAAVEAGVARMMRESCPGGLWPDEGSLNLAGVGSFQPTRRGGIGGPDRSSTTGRKIRRRIAQPRKARKR